MVASLLAEYGFRLIEPDPTGLRGGPTGGHLLVALRDRPTLRHFDPEAISFYAPADAGANLVTVDRLATGDRVTRIALWGHVHVADRIPVENRFLTFGGELRLFAVDDSLTVADLRSPGPIVRWGGHSQGTDGLAGAIGAFFGRLILPVDFVPGAAARIDALPADVIFAAFVSYEVRRGQAATRRLGDPSAFDQWLAAAWRRLRAAPATCAAAEELLADLRL